MMSILSNEIGMESGIENRISQIHQLVFLSIHKRNDTKSYIYIIYIIVTQFCENHQLRRYGPLDSLHAFKTDPFDDPLELGDKKKFTRTKTTSIKRLFQFGDVPLG